MPQRRTLGLSENSKGISSTCNGAAKFYTASVNGRLPARSEAIPVKAVTVRGTVTMSNTKITPSERVMY